MSSRKTVLELYKRLNKIAKEVFDKDVRALNQAKEKIRIEFRKNKDLENQDEIDQKIKVNKNQSLYTSAKKTHSYNFWHISQVFHG